MPEHAQDIFRWLLQALELSASVFHVGRYCGQWRASTAGLSRASFHLVVSGRCWLQRPRCEPLPLERGDAVFLLRDAPHALAPDPQACPGEPLSHGHMLPLAAANAGDTGLVCGFFSFKPGISDLIVSALPDVLLVRGQDPDLSALRAVFELILAETAREDGSSEAMIERLTGLLFMYLLRQRMAEDGSAVGLFAAARREEFGELLRGLIETPEHPWRLSEMAHKSGMSRASFVKHFTQTAGCSPGQFLLALRMQAAGRLLERGRNVDQVAEGVGYHSTAAFARAFKKFTGQQPGAYRRVAMRAVQSA